MEKAQSELSWKEVGTTLFDQTKHLIAREVFQLKGEVTETASGIITRLVLSLVALLYFVAGTLIVLGALAIKISHETTLPTWMILLALGSLITALGVGIYYFFVSQPQKPEKNPQIYN